MDIFNMKVEMVILQLPSAGQVVRKIKMLSLVVIRKIRKKLKLTYLDLVCLLLK
jgi:hypothetical protein